MQNIHNIFRLKNELRRRSEGPEGDGPAHQPHLQISPGRPYHFAGYGISGQLIFLKLNITA